MTIRLSRLSDAITMTAYVCVVFCTDLSGTELHIQVGVGSAGTSESLGGLMVNTLAWYERNWLQVIHSGGNGLQHT